MELLEADFAQLEHINQIIYNNKTHDSWACFDTANLVEQYDQFGDPNTKRIVFKYNYTKYEDIRYDWMIVSITKQSNDTYVYDFEVRNSLWDGKVQVNKSRILDASKSIPADDVAIDKDGSNANHIIITVRGQYKDAVRVCFHMGMIGDGRNIETQKLKVQVEEKEVTVVKKSYHMKINQANQYTHQYDAAVVEEGYLHLDDDDQTRIASAKVTIKPCNEKGQVITGDGAIPAYETTSNTKGVFRITYGAVPQPGIYYCLLTATFKQYTVSMIIEVRKVQKNRIKIDWGADSLYTNVIKGRRHRYSIEIYEEDKFGKPDRGLRESLKGLPVSVSSISATGKVMQTVTVHVQYENNIAFIKPILSYRGYYEDFSRLRISMPTINGFASATSEHLIVHNYYIADTLPELIGELNRKDNIDGTSIGSDYIMMANGTYNVTTPIVIDRSVTIAGTQGNTPIKFDAHNKCEIFQINRPSKRARSYFKVHLHGLTMTRGTPAIKITNGGSVAINLCVFTDNSNASMNHRGCSIYMPNTDDVIRSAFVNWRTDIRNSYFYNNVGNEIQSVGETTINNNLFRTNKASCLKQPEVKVVNVAAGNVYYTNNKSHIKVTDQLTTNHSFAKALTYVCKNAKFNGRGPSQLGGDNTLPVYERYNNQAYTYAMYYYPYEGVRTTIVCSPKRGHERKATGHSSTFKRWVYYDGYYFIRRSAGRGNTYDPWTEQELALPTTHGIYNVSKKKFLTGYNPVFKNNASFKFTNRRNL